MTKSRVKYQVEIEGALKTFSRMTSPEMYEGGGGGEGGGGEGERKFPGLTA